LDLRILKDLARQIVELRILKNLGKPTADTSQLTVEGRERSPPKATADSSLTVRKKDDDMTGGTPIPRHFGWLSKQSGYKI